MIGSLTRGVLRHRVSVVVASVALVSGGVVASGSALSKGSIPGKAIATSARIAHEFGPGDQIAPLLGVISASGIDGLGAGILLDATIVRALLVPALESLLGRWNWWMPALPARLLRVHSSERHAEVRAVA